MKSCRVIEKVIEKFTALELIEELMAEIQKYSDELAILFPKRIQRYKPAMLARFWGYSDMYVTTNLYLYRKDQDHRINDEALIRLRQKLTSSYGYEKTLECIKLIDNYKNSEIGIEDLVALLCVELGQISDQVKLTHDEASQILGFSTESKIEDIRYSHPNYKFSLERLDIMMENIKLIFAYKAQKCYDFIQKYKNLNRDLKEYTHQRHNVGNPHYFKEILPGDFEKAYLFGFLGHDGYITSGRIGLEIHPKDRLIIDKLFRAIELDKSKVKIYPRTRLYIYKGERKEYHTLELKFGCRPMIEELKSHGFTSSKADRKNIPIPIKNLIEQAKLENHKAWMDTLAGKTALAWFLGAYDADGSYLGPSGARYSGRFFSSNKEYLNEIKELFGIKSNVLTNNEPGTIVEIFGKIVVSRGFYSISFSSQDIFIEMINSYEFSLDRKRPQKTLDIGLNK